jgi:hypothetical protein
MRLTHFEITTAALASIVAVLGGVLTALRWIYAQGAASQRLITAVQSNTEATAKLTQAFRDSTVRAEERWIDHDRRLTRVESALRMDSGSPGP